MELTFLGTGGGRYTMISQLRQTGGFILKEEGFMMSVDPGPGALIHSLENGISLGELDSIFVSHGHLDHEGDVEVMIEAMTHGCKQKKGQIISNNHFLNERSEEEILSRYHKEALKKVINARENDRILLQPGIEMEIKQTKHRGTKPVGFNLRYRENTFSYIPDTGKFKGLSGKFSDADYLVLCAPIRHGIPCDGHLNIGDVLELVEEIEPRETFITHLSNYLIEDLENEKRWLEERTDHKIIFPEDNRTYRL